MVLPGYWMNDQAHNIIIIKREQNQTEQHKIKWNKSKDKEWEKLGNVYHLGNQNDDEIIWYFIKGCDR